MDRHLGDRQCGQSILLTQRLLTVSLRIEGLQGDTCDKNINMLI